MYDPRMIPIATSIGGRLASSALPDAPIIPAHPAKVRRPSLSWRRAIRLQEAPCGI
jgi:hypothetical protein